ncbi:hypothetical protein BC351_09820 [Paenibacillus ferrarius]|uniref:Uncharacterized protein n=1 Tax=Paenibacillus ferrarius TaxID=1469647 RepID=A0A1V4H946_9BACL|nr:hypothetical protein BC351_09820 [Paenibacillus ferrarius]
MGGLSLLLLVGSLFPGLRLPFWQARGGFDAFHLLSRSFWPAQLNYAGWQPFSGVETAFGAGSGRVRCFSPAEPVFWAGSAYFCWLAAFFLS